MGLKGFEVTKAADVYSKLTEYKKHYHDKGVYLGFEAMHEHYSMQLGNCTDWTGYPMSGKDFRPYKTECDNGRRDCPRNKLGNASL
jgi:hypothetical protein